MRKKFTTLFFCFNPRSRFFQTLVQWPGLNLFVSLRFLKRHAQKLTRPVSLAQRSFTHSEYGGKTIVDPSQRPTTSSKTPAYLYTQIHGPHYGGKTYFPRPEPVKKRKRVIYTAPPMKGSRPAKRGAKVLHEIYHFQQKNFEPLLPYQPFKRLVREILQDVLLDFTKVRNI